MKLSVFYSRPKGAWIARWRHPITGREVQYRPFAESDTPPSRQSRAAARRLAEEHFADLERVAANEEIPTADRLRLVEFLDLAMTQDPGVPKVGDALRPRTVTRRRQILERFRAFVVRAHGRQVYATDVGAPLVDLYLRDREKRGGLSPTGLLREAQTIKRAFNYGRERGLLPPEFPNPVPPRTRKARTAERREHAERRAYTPDEVHRILDAARHGGTTPVRVELPDGRVRTWNQPVTFASWVYPFCLAAWETGCRPGELRELRWASVRGDMLHIAHATSKTGARRVPITDALAAVLRTLPKDDPHVFQTREGPVSPSAHHKALGRVCAFVGVKYRGMYGFRHAFGLRMAAAGLYIHKLRAIMGHASITTTEIYLEAEAETFADEFRRRAADSS